MMRLWRHNDWSQGRSTPACGALATAQFSIEVGRQLTNHSCEFYAS